MCSKLFFERLQQKGDLGNYGEENCFLKIMAIGIQGFDNQTCQSHGLATKARQKTSKMPCSAAASCQTAGRIAFGHTLTELAWA